MGGRSLVALAAALVMACSSLVSSARAASVSVIETGPLDPQADGAMVTYQAAPGEANRLMVGLTPDRRAWMFRDGGARVDAGTGCVASPDGAVTCSVPPAPPGHVRVVLKTQIDLGDADDTADVSDDVRLDGGPGDDVVAMHAGLGSVALGGYGLGDRRRRRVGRRWRSWPGRDRDIGVREGRRGLCDGAHRGVRQPRRSGQRLSTGRR